MKQLIDQLRETGDLSEAEWCALIEHRSPELSEYLFQASREVCLSNYGDQVYIRGLIEFTNYCRNNCNYCGIQNRNKALSRYRLSSDEILECCEAGYQSGFRTFVLQGGEDGYFTDERMAALITSIHNRYPDCAITLSIGEHSRSSYQRFFDAGANRYLLRHETFDEQHYQSLHPAPLSAAARQQCLWDLKSIGYQVGTGFMVGSPGQTSVHLAKDMLFLSKLKPHMVGIGPFIPHRDTIYRDQPAGSVELTLFMLGLIRLLLPKALLPATTALGTLASDGRQMGMLAGANVVMPNLSPHSVREKYSLYDNKLHTGAEAAEYLEQLKQDMNAVGRRIVTARGDSLMTDKAEL